MPRIAFAPYEYPAAVTYWEKQQQSHWLPSEVSMSGDISDWKTKLTDAERALVSHVLKGFVQSEVFIEEYWSRQVSKWFKKPEIQAMASTFAAFESIHAFGYAYLEQSLGIEDFDGFMHEPTARAKIDRLMATRGRDLRSIARSLAVFSAFNEGVNLFSQFAVLMNFSRFNRLNGVGQIVAYSAKDEALHADAGCWLFRTLVHENPGLLDASMQAELYEAATETIRLEDAFIEKAFNVGAVEGLTAHDLKAFIRHRCNTRLSDLGLEAQFYSDPEALKRMSWFDSLTAGVNHVDFFAQRNTEYAKTKISFDDVWESADLDRVEHKSIEAISKSITVEEDEHSFVPLVALAS